jgi:hypothetical protein
MLHLAAEFPFSTPTRYPIQTFHLSRLPNDDLQVDRNKLPKRADACPKLIFKGEL